MTREKQRGTVYDTKQKRILISRDSGYQYRVVHGRNGGFWELELAYCEMNLPFTPSLKANVQMRAIYTWVFSIQDFRMAYCFIPSKAQYPHSRVSGIIDKLIDFYIEHRFLDKNDAAIPIVKLFFKKFYDGWEVGDKMLDSNGSYLETWDDELELNDEGGLK